MIRFEDVSKRYARSPDALSGVSFRLGKGEMAFLTGHSGAGKSTLLRLVGLVERPTRGRVEVGGGLPDGTQVVYCDQGSGNSTLYVATSSGKTSVGVVGGDPCWSSQGVIAFVDAGYAINTVNPNGSGLATIVPGVSYTRTTLKQQSLPVWSPNGITAIEARRAATASAPSSPPNGIAAGAPTSASSSPRDSSDRVRDARIARGASTRAASIAGSANSRIRSALKVLRPSLYSKRSSSPMPASRRARAAFSCSAGDRTRSNWPIAPNRDAATVSSESPPECRNAGTPA